MKFILLMLELKSYSINSYSINSYLINTYLINTYLMNTYLINTYLINSYLINSYLIVFLSYMMMFVDQILEETNYQLNRAKSRSWTKNYK